MSTKAAVATVAATEVKATVTPVMNRKYTRTDMPVEVFRGKQRQIVATILNAAKEPMSVEEVSKLAAEAGLVAIGGVIPSVRYHLHHLGLLGYVKTV